MESLLSFWRNLFSQWYDGLPEISDLGNASWKFPDPLEFQSWPVNFKTEVCANSAFPRITMHWNKEVETAKSIDDLGTSQSSTGRRDLPDYEMLDAKIASAFKKLLTSVHFRKKYLSKSNVLRKTTWFSRGRQIAHMLYEHFRATGGHEAVQVLSDLFNIRLQNDDVQDLDTRWDQVLLAESETPTGNGPGGVVQVKIAGFCSASDCIGHMGLKEFYTIGSCVSRFSSEQIYSVSWKVESSSRRQRCVTRKFWKRMVYRRESRKTVYLRSEFRGLQNSRKERKMKPSDRSGAPAELPGTWQMMSINSKRRQEIRSTLLPKLG